MVGEGSTVSSVQAMDAVCFVAYHHLVGFRNGTLIGDYEVSVAGTGISSDNQRRHAGRLLSFDHPTTQEPS
jgi:hypothetical protein